MYNPKHTIDEKIDIQLTTTETRSYRCDPISIERDVRQLLADKASGSGLGIWLLVPEHLRLGTWELLRAWTGASGERVEPRLAMQLINEAAMCTRSLRAQRALNQSDFTLANGMAFLASDSSIHNLLAGQTIEQSIGLQIALGQIRKSAGEFPAQVLAIDPHRMHSCTKRHTRRRKAKVDAEPTKCTQTFFCFDTDSQQPVAFLLTGPAVTIDRATIQLMDICRQILNPSLNKPLVLGDAEHCCAQIFSHAQRSQAFDLLCPMQRQRATLKTIEQMDPSSFKPHWAGYATAHLPYRLRNDNSGVTSQMIVQRCGERHGEFVFKPFAATRVDDHVRQLTIDFPNRWALEEFFKNYQDLGWNKAGTLNLDIRYGQMTMALLAQAAIAALRKRIGSPMASWDSLHLARNLFAGLDGDVRVKNNTIVVTYYNAPNANSLTQLYEGLPNRLEREGIRPNIPWLYDFKLDFRFR